MEQKYEIDVKEVSCADECNPLPNAAQDPEGWLERKIQRLPLGYRLVITIGLIGIATWLLAALYQ